MVAARVYLYSGTKSCLSSVSETIYSGRRLYSIEFGLTLFTEFIGVINFHFVLKINTVVVFEDLNHKVKMHE